MRALTYNPGTDQFRIADIPVPKPGDSDVLVRVEACGLNPVDAKIGLWKKRVPQMDASWVPGLDVSGRIVETGGHVNGWRVGDRVLYHGNMLRPHGGFAEYAIQDSRTLIAHPELSPTVAAATPCAGWTAWRALNDKLRASEHDSILIAGGSGGVGSFAIQTAKYLGVSQIIVTCSERNRDYVSGLGATHVIDYEAEDVVGRVMEITDQRGVACGLDTVGPVNDMLVANSLAFEGHMVELVSMVRPSHYKDAYSRGLSFHQLSLGSGHRYGESARAVLLAAGKRFSELVEQGHITIPVLKAIPLDELASALEEMRKQRTVGKLVLVP